MGKKFFTVSAAALTAAAAVLFVLVIQTWSGSKAVAETAMSAPNMVAVTGKVSSDFSVLYVIDTDKKQLAVYYAQGGRRIRFIGARRIKYDFELISFNDVTPRDYSVQELSKKWREQKAKEDDSDKSGPKRR